VAKRAFVVPEKAVSLGAVHSDLSKPLAQKTGIDPAFVPSTEGEMAGCLADPLWRICSGQLYKIMVKPPDEADNTVLPFIPNRALANRNSDCCVAAGQERLPHGSPFGGQSAGCRRLHVCLNDSRLSKKQPRNGRRSIAVNARAHGASPKQPSGKAIARYRSLPLKYRSLRLPRRIAWILLPSGLTK
jgi:hypothetical protein